jgi:hypothetical protein
VSAGRARPGFGHDDRLAALGAGAVWLAGAYTAHARFVRHLDAAGAEISTGQHILLAGACLTVVPALFVSALIVGLGSLVMVVVWVIAGVRRLIRGRRPA